jgi:CDP-glycerol glycerophosphotransferase (TagB/SpsB family)
MKDSDAMISDYSSVAYDYIHLNRQIAYIMNDLREYRLGLVMDNPQDILAGPVLYTIEDFYRFLCNVIDEKDDYKVIRERVLEKIYQFRDGNSCKRLAEHMKL